MRVSLSKQTAVLSARVEASAQVHDKRTRLFVAIEHEGITGYGEIAPQTETLNGDAGLSDILDALTRQSRRLGDVLAREDALPTWSRVSGFSSGTSDENFAVALLEMALLDREVRRGALDIDALWPGRFSTPVQSTVSLIGDDDWNIDPSAQRVRVKSRPGTIDVAALARVSMVETPILLDYNCSVENDDDVIAQLRQLRDIANVVAVEQPYAAGNVVDHARLASVIDVPVSIDEGVRSVRDISHIARYGAARIVCVKPARVGGFAPARAISVAARDREIDVYIGGFFESPYARAVNRRFAQAITESPSDIADVATWSDDIESTANRGGFGATPPDVVLDALEPLWVGN